MRIDREEQQRGQEIEELGNHESLAGALRIEKRRKPQTHLQADDFARRLHCGEHDAHDEAHRHADEQLLDQDEQTIPGAQSDIGHGRQRGRDDQSDEHAQAYLDAPWHGTVTEYRRHHDQAQDTGEGPDETDQPGIELGVGEAEHGCLREVNR